MRVSGMPRQLLAALVVIMAIIVVAVPSSVSAQETASGQALATVLAGLAVVATQNLDFGNVLQGVAKTVLNADAANAGIFTISGAPGSGISIDLNLPPFLSTPTGDDRMDIVFGITDASVDTTANVDPSTFGDGWANTNPWSLPAGAVVGTPASRTAIFLGGRVIPAVNQKSDTYSGLIILTVAYNGT